jgi:hypothetical protein
MHTGRIAAPGVRFAADRPEWTGAPVGADQTDSHPILMRPMRISGEEFARRGILCIARGARERAPATTTPYRTVYR